MRIVVISGRSGSGKSIALDVLEDLGFYCIDNLPIGLLSSLISQFEQDPHQPLTAVSIDARNLSHTSVDIKQVLQQYVIPKCELDVIYLDAQDDVLLQRFSSTRRKHPLTNQNISLAEAINQERNLLDPLANMADLMIDTTHLSVHELRSMIRSRLADHQPAKMSILFESFGFKHGIPTDADFVFDVRHLPNPFWDIELREFTGQDLPIQEFLRKSDHVREMLDHIETFLDRWLPDYIAANRSYMTIAIGCTGGQHRSVFAAEELAARLSDRYQHLQVRHRELQQI